MGNSQDRVPQDTGKRWESRRHGGNPGESRQKTAGGARPRGAREVEEVLLNTLEEREGGDVWKRPPKKDVQGGGVGRPGRGREVEGSENAGDGKPLGCEAAGLQRK